MFTIRRPNWIPPYIPDTHKFDFESIFENLTDETKGYTKFHIGDSQVMQVNLAGVDPATVSVKYDQDSNSIHVLVDGLLRHKMALSRLSGPPVLKATWNQGLLTVTVENQKKTPPALIDIPITEGTTDNRKFLQE
jgi:HSP20 family molecular chaperone IbpA